SSPLARGLLRLVLDARLQGGIIPARAGFTQSFVAEISRPSDHPRSRGVYLFCGSIHRLWLGSSPLARGLRDRSPLP
ncbi:hypothetical protein HMPREF1979_03279, partial [Actinomyces johnsonii F0542]